MCLKEILMMIQIFNKYFLQVANSPVLSSVYGYPVLVPYVNHKKIKNPLPPSPSYSCYLPYSLLTKSSIASY